jgi:gamma-glutamyltranspeptidase/glutathione hydrolase
MGLFDAQPGRPNSVAPGKTTVTNMCPTIVLRDGRPRLALGASGGRLIPSMVTQPATLVVDYDWPADRALAAPRLHHVGDGRLVFEEGLAEAAEQLAGRGFRLDPRPWGSLDLGGQSPAVWFDHGALFGLPDPRRHGAAAAV